MQERAGWNSIYLENHDVARSVSRFGDDSTEENRRRSAKVIAAMQCTMSGTLFVYQGEEIAMANLPRSWGAFYKEEWELRKQKGISAGPDMIEVMNALQRKARDHARNPMQWDDSKHAGFSTARKTWMRVHDDFREWNVTRQQDNVESVLSFWKKMLAFRKKHLACTYGIYTLLSPQDEQIFAYTKDYGDERIIVVLNFTTTSIEYADAALATSGGEVIDCIGTYGDHVPELMDGKVTLRPWEAAVYNVKR